MLNRHFQEFIGLLERNRVRIPFIGIESLLKNKSASPRAKDKIDFEELKRIRGESGSGED